MAEGREGAGIPTFAAVLDDPSASIALKRVLRAWAERDPVDAANDAERLHGLLAARAQLNCRGAP